jgi:hypothetical protein
MLRRVLRPPQLAASLFWSALQRRCPLLALSGHQLVHCTCPLLGVKRTWGLHCGMSASDPKGTSPTKLIGAMMPSSKYPKARSMAFGKAALALKFLVEIVRS